MIAKPLAKATPIGFTYGMSNPPVTPRHPYAVRKVTSGRVAGEKWIVVLNPGGRRVSVHAYIGREGAQAEADSLNITEMVKPHAEDPRPYAERLAEARAAFAAEQVAR